MISAGELRHVIVIQVRVAGEDEYGGEVYTWNDVATVRAKARPLRGRELITAKAEQSETTTMFYLRYISGIDPSMRIVHNGQNYDITEIVNVNERNILLEISAKTGRSEG